VDKITQ